MPSRPSYGFLLLAAVVTAFLGCAGPSPDLRAGVLGTREQGMASYTHPGRPATALPGANPTIQPRSPPRTRRLPSGPTFVWFAPTARTERSPSASTIAAPAAERSLKSRKPPVDTTFKRHFSFPEWHLRNGPISRSPSTRRRAPLYPEGISDFDLVLIEARRSPKKACCPNRHRREQLAGLGEMTPAPYPHEFMRESLRSFSGHYSSQTAPCASS